MTWLCKHGKFVISTAECALHPLTRPHYLFRPWVRWILPLPILIRIAKWRGVANNIWYQDNDFQLQGSQR